MKKTLATLLALVMLLSLCACSKNDTQITDPSTTPSQTATGETTTAPTEESTTAPTNEPTTAPTEQPTTAPTEAPTTPPTTPPAACSHSWNAATCTAPKTCTKCGATEGSAAGHNWNAATCTAPKTCSTCGATEGGAAGHNWNAATCTAPKTCSVCGATEGGVAEHSYQNGACTGCGAAEPPAVVVGEWFLEGTTSDGVEYEKMNLTLGEGTASINIAYFGKLEYDSQEMLDAILANGYYETEEGCMYYYDIFQYNGVYYHSAMYGAEAEGTYTVSGSTITIAFTDYGGTGNLILNKASENTLTFVSIEETLFDEIVREVMQNGRVFTKVQ